MRTFDDLESLFIDHLKRELGYSAPTLWTYACGLRRFKAYREQAAIRPELHLAPPTILQDCLTWLFNQPSEQPHYARRRRVLKRLSEYKVRLEQEGLWTVGAVLPNPVPRLGIKKLEDQEAPKSVDFRRSTKTETPVGSALAVFKETSELFRYYLLNEVEAPRTTVKAYTYAVRLFIWFLANERVDLPPRGIDAKLYVEFQTYCRTKRKLSESTRSSIFTGLRAYFAYLVENGRIPFSPLDRLKFRRGPRAKPRPLRLPHVKKLLFHLDDSEPPERRDGIIIELLYGSGLRISEALGAQVSAIEFSAPPAFSTIRVMGKGAKERVVPMTFICGSKLQQWILDKDLKPDDFLFKSNRKKVDHLTASSFGRLFRGYADAAGLPPSATSHKLRHGFATGMLDGGADIKVIQELLGHANLSVTGQYLEVSIERRHDALRHHPRNAEYGSPEARLR